MKKSNEIDFNTPIPKIYYNIVLVLMGWAIGLLTAYFLGGAFR